ncbi:hypothetical protein GOBAR_DD03589 [Gossypium barbadense]|nr:hypothetical protein GOBAR_DD03589 [Gossypium barbadense]
MNRASSSYIFHESLATTNYGFVTPNIFPYKSRNAGEPAIFIFVSLGLHICTVNSLQSWLCLVVFACHSYGFSSCHLLVLALADSSKYDHYDAGSPQPNPNYGEKPSLYKTELEVEAELDHGAKSEEGEAKSGTGYNKPRPEGETKPEYVKPVYGSKLEGEAKPYYDANPSTNYMPNYEAKKYTYKSKLEEEGGKAKYERKPYVVLTKPEEEKPEEKEQLLPIGVEGIVLCKSGSNYYPIAGASAKVKCVAVDEVGLEKTVPICSVVTDAKGYFFRKYLL